jgi:hypothetical protein
MSLIHDRPALDFDALPVGREHASGVCAMPTLAITKMPFSADDASGRSVLAKKGNQPMTARGFAIKVLIFVAVIVVMTAVAIWLNLGPVASSAS